MSRLIGLYPRDWRTRYEEEFRALIEERPPTAIEQFDIVRSAIDAHLHPQVRSGEHEPLPPVPDHDLRIARRLGVSAVVGAVAWVAAFFVVSIGPIRYDEAGAYRDGAAGLPLLLLAVVLLSSGIGGQLLVLPRDARLARLGAGGAVPFLLLWGLQPWLMPLILVTLTGLIALAVGARRSGAWATGPSLVMIGSCLGVVATTWFGLVTSHGDRMAGGVFLLVGAAVLIPAWLVIGGTLIRRPGEAPRRS